MFFEKVKLNLEKRGFQVTCFQTRVEAADYLNHQIDGKTVGFGGSMIWEKLTQFQRFCVAFAEICVDFRLHTAL